MEFKNFKKDVETAFNNMIAENLFVANVDKDLLWMGYLLSFEDETIRKDHNCNACKSFIRHYGKVVAIDPQTYEIKTFWDDVHTPGYEKTAQALAKLVKEAGIGGTSLFKMLMSFTVVTIMFNCFLMEQLELGRICM